MRLHYYSPNLKFYDLIRIPFISNKKAERKIKEYFSKLTGKNYILITNSCRSSIYLAYKALGIENREIITSPLTCKVAIDPIVESGNHIVFSDIFLDDLNINTEDIEHRISNNTAAIQAIHLGGVSCRMDEVVGIAKKHNLLVIEDCAQSLGAKYKNKYTGSFGDVSCFTLTKNAYGIGGGILATDSEKVFLNAQDYIKNFETLSLKILLFRLIRAILETNRRNIIGNLGFNYLMKFKGTNKGYQTIKNQLLMISVLELKVIAIQLKKYRVLHNKRKNAGRSYYQKLVEIELLKNKNYDPENSSYTKFLLFHPKIDSEKSINKLRLRGIETMHLEQKNGSPVQKLLIGRDKAKKVGLTNYLKSHDHLISLPLLENMSAQDINCVIEEIIK